MPWPWAMAASKAARLFSIRPPPWSPRWAKGRAINSTSAGSVGLDRDNGINLDGGTERQHRNADRAAGVAAGLAEYLLHQLGRAVGDLGLVSEGTGAVDEDAELHDPLDAVEVAQRLLHLCDQHHTAGARRLLTIVDVAVFTETAGHELPFVERKLARNMEQHSGFHDRKRTRLNS